MNESNLPVTLQLGQEGATEAIVNEIQAQVAKKKIIKAKRLRTTAVDGTEKEFWQGLANRAGVRLVEVRGHTAILADPRYLTERERAKRERRRAL
jgi:RNA-binding protein YhbY